MSVVFFRANKIEISTGQSKVFQFLFGYLIVNMTVKTRLDSKSKTIALNVLKICRGEKQNGELFLPLSERINWTSMTLIDVSFVGQ